MWYECIFFFLAGTGATGSCILGVVGLSWELSRVWILKLALNLDFKSVATSCEPGKGPPLDHAGECRCLLGWGSCISRTAGLGPCFSQLWMHRLRWEGETLMPALFDSQLLARELRLKLRLPVWFSVLCSVPVNGRVILFNHSSKLWMVACPLKIL
jgi:hypothetical protein